MGTSIVFKRPDGKDASGYLANASRGNAPGVVVIQEWWGLQDQIKGMCDRFALAGFDALAPDLYKGKVVPYHDTDAAGKEMNSLDFMDATTQTVRGAAQYLSKNGARIGLTGFCLGGAVTIIGATRIPELSAGVVFYGIPPEQAAKPADVKIPLQAHFANKDDWCTPQLVDGFEKAMKAAGKSLELFRYDAEHAFVNEQRQSVHDRAAAELAWVPAFAGTTRVVWSSTLAHSIPPRTRPRHQLVIAVHHLHRGAQAGSRRAHPHLARHFAVGRLQPDAIVSPQAWAIMHLDRLPRLWIDLAAAPAALHHERRRRLDVERGHEVVGMAAERDADAIGLGQRDVIGLADIVERKQLHH